MDRSIRPTRLERYCTGPDLTEPRPTGWDRSNPLSTFRPKYALLPSVPTGNSASKSSRNAGVGLSASNMMGAYGRAGAVGNHDDAVAQIGPAGLSSAASGTTSFGSSAHLLGQLPGGLLLAGYALAALLAAAAFLQRRDITTRQSPVELRRATKAGESCARWCDAGCGGLAQMRHPWVDGGRARGSAGRRGSGASAV